MSQRVTFLSKGIPITTNLFIPPSNNTSTNPAKRPAIVVSHPFGGVKEQTAGLYAELLCESGGFITLAFDAAYQGESGGEPRYLEDLYQRVEEIKSAVSFLITRPDVDAERIGALGICASGGYVPFAAQTDHRIKAVATISALDMGLLFREGLGGSLKREDLVKGLEKAGKDRNLEAAGGKPQLGRMVPNTVAEVTAETPPLYKEGTMYYRTPRAQHPNSVNWYIERSIDMLATYSSYAFMGLIAPRPSLMIAGEKAETLYFSRNAIEKAAEPKELVVVEGKSHIDLYDDTTGVLPKLLEFMKQHLVV